MLLWASLLILATPHAAVPSTGASECPCLSSDSALAHSLGVALGVIDSSLHPQYGTNGCQAYDSGRSTSIGDCTGAAPAAWCSRKWCYVDTDLCPQNATLCTQATCSSGPCKLGDLGHWSCRTRNHLPTNFDQPSVTVLGLFYSYETCGNKDFYSVSTAFEHGFNTSFQVAPLSSPPWSMERNGVWTGILPDYLAEVVLSLGSSLAVADPRVSEDSLQLAEFNGSSWTACIHDISIGRLDFCLGDFWVTEQRLKLANFLPSLEMDNFYLVMLSIEQDSFIDILYQPFRPFQGATWFYLAFILIVMGLLIALVDFGHNEDDFPDDRWWAAAIKGAWFSFLGFTSGGPVNAPVTPSARMMTLGLGAFLILTVSAYTANLATFLITSKLETGVSSLEHAVGLKMRICVAEPIKHMLSKLHPELDDLVVPMPFYQCARALHEGLADAAVESQGGIDRMYSGDLVRADCNGLSPGSTSYCPSTSSGLLDERRDCSISKAGKGIIVLSMNIALPVAKKIQHPIGWAHIASLESAVYTNTKARYSSQLPQKMENCPNEGLSDTASMPVSAFVGTTIICSIPFVLGLGMAAVERWHARRSRQSDDVVPMDDGDRIDKVRMDIQTVMKQLTSLQEAVCYGKAGLAPWKVEQPGHHPHGSAVHTMQVVPPAGVELKPTTWTSVTPEEPVVVQVGSKGGWSGSRRPS